MGGGPSTAASGGQAQGGLDFGDIMRRYQQVVIGGVPQGEPIGGIDIPPADMTPEQTTAPFRDVYSPHELLNIGMGSPNNNPWINPNYTGSGPTTQSPIGGPNTIIPTFWDAQGIPFAVPVSTGDVNTNAPNWFHAGQVRKNQ